MKKVVSMVGCIVLIGLTLGSLGLFYLSYQSTLSDLEKKLTDLNSRYDQEKADHMQKADEEYDQKVAQWEEDKKKAEENGQFFSEYKPIHNYLWDSSSYDNALYDLDDKNNKVKEGFRTTLIIHGIIIGFLILSEIGLLLVLPKKDKIINVNINK